jgi:sugar (pentulose or hexulose) kinase
MAMARAVAVDLGATSGRLALGELKDGRISFRVVRQEEHEAIERNGRLEWDFPKLLNLCQSGVDWERACFCGKGLFREVQSVVQKTRRTHSDEF